MRPLLPRPLATLFVALGCVGCAHRDPLPDPATTAPPAPLPAATVARLGTMEAECDGLVGALAAYKTCPNLEDADIADLEAWIERANRDFAASRQALPDAPTSDRNARGAIAQACHKATDSVTAAAERCEAGPRPKVDQ